MVESIINQKKIPIKISLTGIGLADQNVHMTRITFDHK